MIILYITIRSVRKTLGKYVEMQDLYVSLIEDDGAKKYFEAETKFNVMIADVNKMIGEAVKEVL